MPESGASLLPFLYPDFYAKSLPIERRNAMAQMLMQQGGANPGSAPYGGLASAGKMLAGALLGRSADTSLGQLYTGADSPGIHDSGQITNSATPNPDLQGDVPQPDQYQGTDQISLLPKNQGQALGGALLGKTPQSPTTMANGLPILPGLSEQASNLLLLSDPGAYLSAVARNSAPTDYQKIVGQLYPQGSPQYTQAMQAFAQKQTTPDSVLQTQYAAGSPMAGGLGGPDLAFLDKLPPELRTIAYTYGYGSPQFQQAAGMLNAKNTNIPIGRNGNILPGANGPQIFQPPQSGVQNFYPNGLSGPAVAAQEPGYAQAQAGITGANAAAQSANTIRDVTLANGATVPMWAGAATQGASPQLFGPQGGAYPPVTGSQPQSPAPSAAGPAQAAPVAQPAAAPAPPPQIGQSTAAGELQKHIGTTAAEDAKFQAAGQKALAWLDQALKINPQTPDSTFTNPDIKAEFSRKFGGTTGPTNTGLWHLYMDNGLVGAMEEMKSIGGGRMPTAMADEIIKARGIDVNDPVPTRETKIRAMQQVIRDSMAASHNAVANMNAPDALTTTTQQPMGAGGPQQRPGAPSPQDIVNELRRRGVVK